MTITKRGTKKPAKKDKILNRPRVSYDMTNQMQKHAINHELQATNEELQCTIEELETAQEELQSSNEALTNINDALQNKNYEITLLNKDLHNLITHINIPIIIVDAKKRIRQFTPSSNKMMYLTPNDIGRPFRDIKTQIKGINLDDILNEVMKTSIGNRIEIKDEDNVWYNLIVKPYQSLNNKVDGAIIMLVDINSVKRSNERLMKAYADAQSVIQSLPAPVLLIDANYNINMANRCFLKTYKLDKQSVVGKSIVEIEEGTWNIPELIHLIHKTIDADISFKEFEVEHKFPVGVKTILLNASQINLPGSGSKAAVLAVQDVTHKKEREYRKIYNRLKLALDVGQIGTWEFDMNNYILKGDERMFAIHGIIPNKFNYSFEAWMETIHENDREMVITKFRELLNQKDTLNIEYRTVLATEEIRIVHTYATILPEEKPDEFSVILGTSLDVTEEKRLTNELINEKQKLLLALKEQDIINHELESFAYITSHDLKAPLRGIESLTTWIEKDKDNKLSAESAENLALLRNRVKRMGSLIDGILQYTRAGKINLHLTSVNTKTLLDEIIVSLNPSPNISFHFINTFPTFTTAQLPLSQVFANLISNAIKYNNREHGWVKLACKEQDFFYEFSVSDNGPGIDPIHHEKIFGLFQTLQSKDTVESTGIGLSIVKKIVELSKGHVTVESALGKGATFRFTWPKTYTVM